MYELVKDLTYLVDVEESWFPCWQGPSNTQIRQSQILWFVHKPPCLSELDVVCSLLFFHSRSPLAVVELPASPIQYCLDGWLHFWNVFDVAQLAADYLLSCY